MTGKDCKVCGFGTRVLRGRQFAADYYYCGRCGFLFMDEAGIPAPQQERERYLKHSNTLEDTGYVRMLETFIETAVLPFHRGIKTALDFGSGPGPVLSVLLRRMGIEVDIYDVYFAPEPVYRDKTYDLITCTEVLEHLSKPLETLAMLKSHLNGGGILAIMTLFHPVGGPGSAPGPAGLVGGGLFKDWWYRRDPTHISFFRAETFRYIAGRLGMAVVMTDGKNTVSLRKI